MNTPISWIKAYVPDLDCTVQEYVDKMTLSGSHVENAVYLDKNLEKIVVGRIEKIEKHPDADKLVICQVNVGDEEVQIVTGASNVFKGAMVPVVLDGGRVAGGHDGSPNPENGIKIKKGKLRGVPSYGMMCSIEELGSTRDMYPEAPEDGIYIFDESKDVKPGDDAVAALGLRDAVVEFEITSNRVDCFSMIGMAREAAATFEKPFYAPEVKEVGNNEKAEDYISVEVEATDLCPRYTARIVKNIKLAPSPEWMQRRLAAMGIRPINNIVDITNYVMEEYGQPMHAYDLNKIRGHKIVVKRANDGDVYTTLDGQERKLDKDVLMINDAEGPVGIAGIMGGENSMITDDIQTMLFEAATFDGTNIRLSSKRIGLRTDASGKFEKGLDPENALEAINRACQLVEELGAGEVVGGVVDVYPNPVEDVKIPFEPAKYNKLLGTNVSEEKMMEYFDRLEIGYDKETNMLLIPSFRQDLRCSADIAEEVARFFGYEHELTDMVYGFNIEELLLAGVYQKEKISEMFAGHDVFHPLHHGAVVYFHGKLRKIADQTKAYELAGNEAVVKPWIFYKTGETVVEYGPNPYLALYYMETESREKLDEVTEYFFDKMSMTDPDGQEIAYRNQIPDYFITEE